MPVSSSNKLFKTETLVSDLDTRRQYAQVFFITRPLNSGSVGLYHGLSTNRSLALSANHWMLFIVFSDISMVIEGLVEDGLLVPKCSVYKEKVPITKLCILGMTKISPAEVKQLADSNPLNGTKYSFLTNNCHNWMNYALKEMNISTVPCNLIIGIFQILLFIIICVIGSLFVEFLISFLFGVVIWISSTVYVSSYTEWSTLEGLLSYIHRYWHFVIFKDKWNKKFISQEGLNLEDILSDTNEQYTQVYLIESRLEDSSVYFGTYRHWKLQFTFLSSSLIIEGVNENGILIPKCRLQDETLNEGIYGLQGMVMISPAKVKELADSNSLNGSTYIKDNNCQTWVNNVLCTLNLGTPPTSSDIVFIIVLIPSVCFLVILPYLTNLVSAERFFFALNEAQVVMWPAFILWCISVLHFLFRL